MRLTAEFTTEPFVGEGDLPEHVTAAAEACRAAGVEVDLGPFGTSATGDADALVAALADAMRSAFRSGATRLTLRLDRLPEASS